MIELVNSKALNFVDEKTDDLNYAVKGPPEFPAT